MLHLTVRFVTIPGVLVSPMKLSRPLAFTALVLVLFTVRVPPVGAANAPVVYVSPTGDDANGTGSAASPYKTIAHAVATVDAGTTVVLEPGTYPTMVELVKRITVESNGDQPNAAAATIIDATNQPRGVWIHGSAAAGAVVRGLTVKNANGSGILVADTTRVVVENNLVTDNALQPGGPPPDYAVMAENKAIQLQGTDGVIVQNNTVTDNKHGGIAVLDSSHHPALDNRVAGNLISGNQGDCGVVLASYVPGQGVQKNVVEKNVVKGNVAGIVVAADPVGTTATDNVVTGNDIEGNQLPGVIVHSNAKGQIVSGNVVSDNTIAGNGSDPGVNLHDTTGIAIIGAVDPVTNTRLQNNTIHDERVSVWQYNPRPTSPSPLSNLFRGTRALLVVGAAAIAVLLVIVGIGRLPAKG